MNLQSIHSDNFETLYAVENDRIYFEKKDALCVYDFNMTKLHEYPLPEHRVIAVLPDDGLAVLDSDKHIIIIYNKNAEIIKTINSGFFNGEYIIFNWGSLSTDSTGTLTYIVSNNTHSSVYKFTNEYNSIETVHLPFNHNKSFQGNNRLIYFTSRDNQSLISCSLHPTVVSYIISGTNNKYFFDSPIAIRGFDDGTLWINNRDESIRLFTTSGDAVSLHTIPPYYTIYDFFRQKDISAIKYEPDTYHIYDNANTLTNIVRLPDLTINPAGLYNDELFYISGATRHWIADVTATSITSGETRVLQSGLSTEFANNPVYAVVTSDGVLHTLGKNSFNIRTFNTSDFSFISETLPQISNTTLKTYSSDRYKFVVINGIYYFLMNDALYAFDATGNALGYFYPADTTGKQVASITDITVSGEKLAVLFENREIYIYSPPF